MKTKNLIFLLAYFLIVSPRIHAAAIFLSTSGTDELITNGSCSLREAIQNGPTASLKFQAVISRWKIWCCKMACA